MSGSKDCVDRFDVKGGSEDCFDRFDVKGGNKTSYVNDDQLPLFTRYEVKIAAYNKAGIGPWSDTQYVETKQGSKKLFFVIRILF